MVVLLKNGLIYILADGSVIYFGEDQDITVTHVHNDGLIIKSIPTADNNPLVLTLQTGETTMVADEPIAQIHFQSPDEASGTDAILIAATIQATAEGNWSSSSNATSLDFYTGNSAAAGSDGGSMILGSTGNLTLKDLRTADGSSPTLTLQTGDTDMAADDILGKISFQAPDEGTGTDAILVAAAIQARSEGNFAADANATSLDFMTGLSGAAAKRWSITSAGSFLNAGTNTIDMNAGELILDADADTSITADTDDQIDIKIAGADDFQLTANTFTVLSGSTLAVASGATIANSGTATGFGGGSEDAYAGVLETNANFVDQVIFGPAVDGVAWNGLWNKASLFSSLMLATIEDEGSNTEINIWDLTEQSSGAINTTPLGTVDLGSAATPTAIAAAMGYLIVSSEDGIAIIDPHSGSWAERTEGWPRTLSSSTIPALTNNDVQDVAAGCFRPTRF